MRFHHLIRKGEEIACSAVLRKGSLGWRSSFEYQERYSSLAMQWRMSSLALLEKVCGNSSHFFVEFRSKSDSLSSLSGVSQLKESLGILRAASEEFESNSKFDTPEKMPSANEALVRKLLTDTERLWLRTLYEHWKTGKELSPRAIEMQLAEKLPHNFTMNRLLFGLGRNSGITILGIALLDPQNPVVSESNEIIVAIRNFLKENPERQLITAKEISERTTLNETRIERLLEELSKIGGRLYRAGINGTRGWSAINLGDPETFKNYRMFASMQDIVESLPQPMFTVATVGNRQIDAVPMVPPKHVSAPAKSSRLSPEARIGLLIGIRTILLTVIAIIISFSIPEVRGWICGETGYLCSTPRSG
jgi:hypothetical protein